MKKSLKFFLSLTAVAAAFFTACNPKEEPIIDPTLNVEEVTLSFASTGNDSQTFEVYSDGQWIVNGPEWITVTPASGKGDAIVTVTVTDNVDAEGVIQAPRSGKITITLLENEKVSFTVTVEQEGDSALDKSHTYKKVSDVTSGKAYLLVAKNTEGEDVIPILFGATGTYGYPKPQVVEVVDDAVKLEDGESGLIFTACEGGFTIQQTNGRYIWHQSGYNTWSCSDDLGTDGYVWTVEMQADGSAKIVDTANGGIIQYGNGGYTSFAAYSSMDDAAVLPFLYEDTQDPVINTDKLACSVPNVTVASSVTEASFKIVSNLGWTVTKDEGDWITSFTESGENDGEVVVKFDANTTEEDRVATFTVNSTSGDKTLTLTLTQSAPVSSFETFAEVIAVGDGNHNSTNALVVAVGGTNTVVYDQTAYMFIYDKNKVSTVGDILELSGATTLYNGCPEWNNPTITVKSSGNTVEHPQAVELDEAALAAYAEAPCVQYAKVTGIKSGYLVSVGEQVVSIYSNETIPDGKVEVYGYTIGYRTDKSQTLLVATSFTEIIEVPDAKIYINEVSTGEKKLELYNASEQEVSLKGYSLKQRNDATAEYKNWDFASLAEEVKIPAGGFVVVNCKQDTDATGPTFGLSGTKGFQLQLTFGEEVIDYVDNLTDITAIEDTQSYGRKVDGGEEWVVFGTPSLGESNAKGRLVVDATTCAELNAAILAGKNPVVVDFSDYVEVTYVNGKNILAEDATGGVLLYGTGIEAVAGARFKGYAVVGVQVYSKLPEVTSVPDVTGLEFNMEGATHPCASLTIAELLASYDRYLNCKVKIEGVSVTDGWQGSASDRNGEIAQGDDKLAVRVQVATDTLAVATGCEGDIVVWPSVFNDNKQLGFWPADYAAGETFFTVTKSTEPEPVPETALKNCGEINAAILAGETALTIKLENPAEITLMGSDKKSIYIQDETGAVLVYSADLYTMLSGAGAVAGAAVQGEFTATATVFKGLPEITAAEVGASNITVTNKFPCMSLTIADLLADFDKYLNCKVKISDVAVNDGWSGSDKNGVIAQGETTIPLYVKTYNSSITVEVPTGAKGNFTGFVAYNNTTKQLTFWEDSGFEATEITGIINVKSSLSLEEGATANLAASVNSGAALSYASSDEAVATVSAEGVVTAVKEGTATITVSAPAQGIYTAASAEVAVTVTAAQAGGDVTVLYEDKFDWLSDFITAYNADKSKPIADFVYGEYADTKARTDYSNSNSANLNTNSAYIADWPAFLAEQGYTNLHTTYCQYAQGTPENPYMKFCKKGNQDGLSFKPFKEAHESVTISVDWAIHNNGTVLDESHLQIVIEGDGEFENGTKSSDPATSEQTTLEDHNFTHSSFVIKNVTADTVVKICVKEGFDNDFKMNGQHRFYLDNILIVK